MMESERIFTNVLRNICILQRENIYIRDIVHIFKLRKIYDFNSFENIERERLAESKSWFEYFILPIIFLRSFCNNSLEMSIAPMILQNLSLKRRES